MDKSIEPAHLTSVRRSVNDLVKHMSIERTLLNPAPAAIFIFDDVLTTGAHFKAVETILRANLPDVALAGLFLARRAAGASPI